MHDLKLSQKVVMPVFVSLVGFVIASTASFRALSKINVNGPRYQRIVQGKDLVAVILPPSGYIIESYLVALQLRDTTSAGQCDKAIASPTACARITMAGTSSG